ncbi:hypothetical protein D6D01_06627 [Aureobasidium pullulans]|uniref:Uncharacterized protein n=1 Tax=Aureobasidium pullulans TaxID=5580 RepID=A0A4S9KY17_AURPU|nr:hypothetical protein D6D01_06627 [Aureobasidium pullulans]
MLPDMMVTTATEPSAEQQINRKISVEQIANTVITEVVGQPETISDTMRRSTNIFDLPLEIRLMIYKEALPAHNTKVPALLLCSLRIYQEASSLCTRVLSVEFFGGSYCHYPDFKTQTQRFQTVADRVKKASTVGIPIRFVIVVRCGGQYQSIAMLQPVVKIIHSTPALQIDVVPHSSACVPCNDSGPGNQQKALRQIKDLFDRVVDDREHGFIRAAAYLASS